MTDVIEPRGAKEKRELSPHVVVLFGATGDLARRKLLPGLFHLFMSKLAPPMRIVGTSLDDMDSEGFREIGVKACSEFSSRVFTPEAAAEFGATLTYVPQGEGAEALAAAVREQLDVLGSEARMLHYLSVPPKAAMAVLRCCTRPTS